MTVPLGSDVGDLIYLKGRTFHKFFKTPGMHFTALDSCFNLSACCCRTANKYVVIGSVSVAQNMYVGADLVQICRAVMQARADGIRQREGPKWSRIESFQLLASPRENWLPLWRHAVWIGEHHLNVLLVLLIRARFDGVNILPGSFVFLSLSCEFRAYCDYIFGRMTRLQ